jgi:PIN domain nuclease of toxin-antitoxin system
VTPGSPEIVLDASALIALVRDEPGAANVRRWLPTAAMSAVNFGEVACVLRRSGMPESIASQALHPLVADPMPFTLEQSWRAADLYARTRDAGLSFGDCACLALAALLGCPALTTDRPWASLDLGIRVELIR